jgi:thiol-disulfide isomerase/thioredoxin
MARHGAPLEIQPAMVARVGVVAVVVVFIAIVAFGRHRLEVGSVAPPAHGAALDGAVFDLQAQRGRFVLVNIWATWCGPCLHELPDLVTAAQQHPDVQFVGLATADSPRADIDDVVARFHVPYPVVPIDHETELAWQVRGVPASFLINPDGTIAFMAAGAVDAAALDALLAIPSAAGP